MKKILYENLPYLAILLVCLFNVSSIVRGSENTIMRKYGKMTDEEKKLYDISKVKMSQILYILSLVLVTVLAFVFSVIFPNIIYPNTFLAFYILEIIVLFILSETKLILNGFCKKNRINQFVINWYSKANYTGLINTTKTDVREDYLC
ncbi:hypothetical protein [Clostridium sp. HBUAS56010]|uniref:hypothetical protein n=1 Tax=Clostridium sp. HBUAS56010 TaxID=2571127 RepID=UPI0011787C41|nr:hypothetical protein [Clostridium sp. HBUAS56010]